MLPNTSYIDLVLQYALLVAGEEDDLIDRQLGPIHLIKYVYLADLFHAERKSGESFTGIPWQFYKFGPWSQNVNERIEPALCAINAEKRTFSSSFEDKDDWVRWSLRDSQLLREKARQLPSSITIRLRRDIHKFRHYTASLLDYVYSTKPMLSAAPNDYLNLSLVVEDTLPDNPEPQGLRMDKLSNKKKKALKERLLTLQDKQKDARQKQPKLVNPVKNPRYDEIYEEGVAWLDDLAGPKLTPGDKVAEFSDDVWKSPERNGEDVP